MMTAILAPMGSQSSSSCESNNQQLMQLREQYLARQDTATGYKKGAAAQQDQQGQQLVTQMNSLIDSSIEQGCNPPRGFSVKEFNPGVGGRVASEITPFAPGESKIPPAPTFNFNQNFRFDDGSSLPLPGGGGFTVPDFTFPHVGEEKEKKNCGEWASNFANDVYDMGSRVTYKNDCAGASQNGNGRAAPNKSSTSCNGRQYGKFGFVFASYNNKFVSVDISDYWLKAPGLARADDPNILAFSSRTDGRKDESKCSITRMNSCGKPGDIVLLQTSTSAGLDRAYNHWLIYDGSSFLEAQDSSNNPIRRGALKPEYASMSYEIRRLDCSK